MFTKIKKRDGTTVQFDPLKVTTALTKAGKATGEFCENTAKDLTCEILTQAEKHYSPKELSVEQLQDIVENVLLNSQYKRTAKAYILYRDQHAVIRKVFSNASVDVVNSYLEKSDWEVSENSNMSYSLQGLHNYISSESSKIYWLHKIYPEEVRKSHLSGDIHIHDLGMLSVYCVGWDLHDLLVQGFKGAYGKVQSGPPKHLTSALGQINNFFYTLQGEAAGAQAFSSFDTLLAPFVRYDNLNYKQVKQALQAFVFNLNVPTRVGFQTPFTNITMDLVAPSTYADMPVVIGGMNQVETYRQFQDEMDMINKAFMEVMCEGDAKGRVFTFPIPTYNITKDFDWDNPVLENLWEATAKYGIPYFANFINSDMSPDDARSMCCRLRLDTRELKARGGGLFGSNPLTGSIGVVTINLPRIGYLAKDEKEFMSLLKNRMEIAKDSLETKRKVLESFGDKNLYPYTSFYLRKVKRRFGKFWENHFSTIGLLGMNEAIINLKKKDIASEEGQDFAKRMLDYMRDLLLSFQEETGNYYNLEATPAEGTAYRLALKDKKKFPDIVVANEVDLDFGAEPFYTNSTHLPVNYTDDLFEVLDLQDDLQTRYTGGTVLHGFLGEQIHDPKIVKDFVKKVCENYRLPYFTFTPTFSVCPSHGYISGENNTCPKCQARCEVYSRVVGYLRPVSQWNTGKQSEYDSRTTYELDCAPQKQKSFSKV